MSYSSNPPKNLEGVVGMGESDHPDVGVLTRYATHDLDSGEEDRLFEHLAECEICCLFIQSLQDAIEASHDGTAREPRGIISRRKSRVVHQRKFSWQWTGIAAAALLVGMLLGPRFFPATETVEFASKSPEELETLPGWVRFSHQDSADTHTGGNRVWRSKPQEGDQTYGDLPLVILEWEPVVDGAVAKIELFSKEENLTLFTRQKPPVSPGGILLKLPSLPDGEYELRVFPEESAPGGSFVNFEFHIQKMP